MFVNEKWYFMHIGTEILKVIGTKILNLKKTSTTFRKKVVQLLI